MGIKIFNMLTKEQREKLMSPRDWKKWRASQAKDKNKDKDKSKKQKK